MKNILVTGATGAVGRQVVSQLLARKDVRVRAMVRNPESAGLPPEVEPVAGDLTVPESLDACLEGIDAVFLMWIAPDTTVPDVIARIGKRAKHVAFLSNFTVRDDSEEQNFPVTVLHARIERLIAATGIQWTFLRPGAFAANASLFWMRQIRTGDVVRWPYADAVLSPIHERDIAAVAVRSLCLEGHHGKKYLITGPEALTQREQVRILGEALERPLRFEEITPDEARVEMASILAPEFAEMFVSAFAMAIESPAPVTRVVEEVLGVPARRFYDWAVDHADEFRRAV